MRQDLISKLSAIKRTSEILLEHYETRGFKDNLMKEGLKNILNMSQEAIAEIEEEKAPEPPRQ